MENIKNFLELTRGYSVLATFASCFVVYSYASYYLDFSFFNFLLILIALCCVQMGANLFDDYIDLKEKTSDGTCLCDVHFDCFRDKAKLIKNGTYTLKQVKFILCALFSIAVLTGYYFAFLTGWQVLLYALAGGLLTIFYPYSTKYYCGDFIVGLAYGPLLINGAFFALTGEFSSNLFYVSWAIFFSTIVLLHTHNIMDWEFDIKANKKTLAIFCENKENAIKMLKFIIVMSYFVVVLGVLTMRLNPNTFYVFFTLPIAVKLLESMKDYIYIKDVKFEPRWYYGMFENWEQIKEGKIDFFMYRFYLARNFGFFFALFLAIGAMV